MNAPLAQIPEASLTELSEASAGMQQFIRATDTSAQKAALDSLERRGAVGKVFPGKLEREKQRIDVGNLKQMAEAKSRLLGLYTEAQIEIARRRADALISVQALHLQTQLTSFAAAKLDDMSTTVNSSRTKFAGEIAKQFTELDAYRHIPPLFERAEQSVTHQMNVFFDSIEILLDGFTAALRNKMQEIHKAYK